MPAEADTDGQITVKYYDLSELTKEQREQIDATLRARYSDPKFHKENADTTAAYDRIRRSWPHGGKQEELFRAGREYGMAELEEIIRNGAVGDDLDALKRRIAHAVWNQCRIAEAIREKRFVIDFSEFADVIWREGWPSLEDRAIESLQQQAPGSIGAKIRHLREQCCWTQDDLAGKTGLSVAAISQHERGLKTPGAAARGYYRDAFNKYLGTQLNSTLD